MLADPLSPEATKHEINVIPMNFRKDYRPKKDEPGEFVEVHAVDLVKKGSHGEATPWTINALKKDEMLWPFVKPYYDRWLEGQEDPVDGTPIDVLPFIPRGLIDHLRYLNIRTAEDLADLTDNDMQRVGMGARLMVEKARKYIDAKSGEAKFASLLADRDAENEQLRAEIDELKAVVNELTPAAKKTARKG